MYLCVCAHVCVRVEHVPLVVVAACVLFAIVLILTRRILHR